MRILGAGRWIWVVGVVVVLSGCTGGSVPADVGLGTGVGPPAAGAPPTVSVSPSRDLVGDGPVLDIAALPFAEESDAALPI